MTALTEVHRVTSANLVACTHCHMASRTPPNNVKTPRGVTEPHARLFDGFDPRIARCNDRHGSPLGHVPVQEIPKRFDTAHPVVGRRA